MLGVPPPNRDRFLSAIAERVSPERVQKLYLFSPIRQGAIETGVAVLACDPQLPDMGAAVGEDGSAPVDPASDQRSDQQSDQQSAIGNQQSAIAPESFVGEAPVPPLPRSPAPPSVRMPTPSNATEYPRPVVLTARYRHTLKGADRGKWEFDVHEQADAPLATLERVIQGVQHRLAEANEPELISVDALRAALADGVWTPPAR